MRDSAGLLGAGVGGVRPEEAPLGVPRTGSSGCCPFFRLTGEFRESSAPGDAWGESGVTPWGDRGGRFVVSKAAAGGWEARGSRMR